MTGDITYAALCWLRYQKNCDIVCTELGTTWMLDASGIYIGCEDGKPASQIEVEVKTNIADIRRDFCNKEHKHKRYAEGKKGTPNWVYFAVPSSIEKEAVEIIKAKGPKYGVLSFNAERFMAMSHSPWHVGNIFVSVRRCTRLTKDRPFPALLYRATRRLQNEYFGYTHTLRSMPNRIEWDIKDFGKRSERRERKSP